MPEKAVMPQDVFRSYDVRGEYPTVLNEEVAYHVGRAFVVYSGATHVVVGGDGRISTESLRKAVIEGITNQGADATDIGLASTDALYFATHHYPEFSGGIMITASHMPQEFNGFKFLDSELRPIGKGSGMEELYTIASEQNYPQAEKKGKVHTKDIWKDFKNFVFSFVDEKSIKPFKVAMDAGNGMGGYVVQRIFNELPITTIPLFFEVDGTFPNHEANPILPENRVDLVNKVIEIGADLGIAWDADCDRVYFINEKGQYIQGDFITALVGLNFLDKYPGAGIVYDIRASHAVKNLIEAKGGKAHAEKVGHSYIKNRMRKEDAVFGGEISGHYYLKDNAYADNSFIVALIILEMMSTKDKPLSELIKDLGDYYVSGEINSEVENVEHVLKTLQEKYADAEKIDHTDGITIEYSQWHFNVRPSSNDPVIRLNLEANSQEMMEEKRDEVLAIIRGS